MHHIIDHKPILILSPNQNEFRAALAAGMMPPDGLSIAQRTNMDKSSLLGVDMAVEGADETVSAEQLRPCPFCGSDAILIESIGYHIICSNAGCAVATQETGFAVAARRAWNRRAADREIATLNQRIEELSAHLLEMSESALRDGQDILRLRQLLGQKS